MKNIYSQSEFRTHLEEKIGRITKRVIHRAETEAVAGRPTIDAPNQSVCHEFHLEMQGLLVQNAGHHGTDFIKQAGAQQMRLAQERIDALENQRMNVVDKLLDAESNFENTAPPYNIWSVRFAIIGMVVTSGFEGIWSIPVWENILNQTYLESVVSGLLFGVVIGLFCHLTAESIKRIQKRALRRVTATIVFAVCFVLFYLLGSVRADIIAQESFNQYGTEVTSSISALAYGLLSTLLIFVGTALSYLLMPSKAQKRQMDTYRQLESELASLQQQEQEINEKIEQEKAEISQELLYKLDQYNQGETTEIWLINQAHLLREVFKNKNISFRKDGVIPSSFSSPYPFTFQKFYNKTNVNN